MQVEAIVVTFALLEDQLMDNQHQYRFLLKSLERVYKSLTQKHIKATFKVIKF